MIMKRECFLIWFFFYCSSLMAALDLSAPYFIDNTQVVPPGVRVFRFVNIGMSVDSMYNASGQIRKLGADFTQPIQWKDLINNQQSELEKGLLLATLKKSNINLSQPGGPGMTSGEIHTAFTVRVPALAVGLTDRFTMAVAIPIVSASISADLGFQRSSDGQKWVDQLCETSISECRRVANLLNGAIANRISSYGYQPISSRSFTALGDVQVIGKYLVTNDASHALSLKSTVVLPTGVGPNLDQLIDLPTGGGQFQLGLTLNYDHRLPLGFEWNTFAGGMSLLPNRLPKRIPQNNRDPLSPESEWLLRRWGFSTSLGTGLQYAFHKIGLKLFAGYQFQYMAPEVYQSGSLYSQERYSYLNQLKPAQSLHASTLMATFSTVDWFLSKKFFYPFMANLLFSLPLGGRNVTAGDVFSGELILFF